MLLLAAASGLAATSRTASPVVGPGVAANRALMERVLAQSRVDRVPVPPETSYLGELYRAAQRAVFGALLRGSRMLRLPQWAGWAAAVGLAVVAVLLLLARLRPRRRRGRGREEASKLVASAPAAAERDAAAWRAELERYLAAGLMPEALEALWWWLARSLAGSQAEADWTSRDLIVRSRRQDLRPLVRSLDLFTYGPRRPDVAELQSLTGRLEEALS